MASKPRKRKASSKDDGDAEDYLTKPKKTKDAVDEDEDDAANGSPFKYTQPVVSRSTGRIRKKSSKLREMEEDAMADAEELEQLEDHKTNVNASKKKSMKSEPTSPLASMGSPKDSPVTAKSPKKSKSAPVVQEASPGKDDESMIKLLLTSPAPSVATLDTDAATKSTTKKSKSVQLEEVMQPQDVETQSDNTSALKLKIHLGSDPGVETVVASSEQKPKKAPKKTPKKKKDVTAEVETNPGMAIEPMDDPLVVATPPPKSAKKPAKPKIPKTPKIPKKEIKFESEESELELGGSVFASEAPSPVKTAKTPKVKKPKAPKKPKKSIASEMESITVERCFDEPEDEIPVHEVVLPSMLHDEDESETIETTVETVENEPIEDESEGSFLGGSTEVKPTFKLPKEPKPKKAKTQKVPKVNKKVKIGEDGGELLPGSSEEMLSQDSPQQFECLKSGEVVKRKGKHQSASKKKRRRRSGPTAYMLYCKSIRGRIQEQKPDLDFATTSKMLGERWHGLPEKEKMNWKRKAKRICKKTMEQNMQQVVKKSNENQYIKAQGKRYGTMTKRQMTGHIKGMASNVSGALELGASMSKTTSTNPVDGAAHLKLLGDSLTLIGTRLIDHKGFIAVQGSLSVLLDSLISALGPLTCLTKQLHETNGCSEEQLSEILDNIAYVMPGL
ncbi:unnamed protein product [Owenia fusiformis]|uniref:Uncharacterized protein n=1 Tax=Owenia fusiformis TaxID=6347 RepID=A0A8J1URY4_OWEFU|nr:unnamed protein product [Owenia fusiformis]